MNQRQKEVQQAHLDEEKAIIRRLKQIYEQAAEDCEQKIQQLSSRRDLANLQTIIYQKQYQEALKKQLEGILDSMNTEEFTSIAQYLEKCYENGFFGNLYDLHGQGIPLILPIDQKQVVRAVQTDSKLSEGLYSRLGEDTKQLKKTIQTELSRGIANGSSWLDMAAYIAEAMKSPYNKALNNAIRIARTEGHRIQNQAALDNQYRAKEAGADIVKQWDSTLDKRTRPHHQQLDGQLREIDEEFEISGRKAMAPGLFGVAEEDINCRCCLSQRAKYALDEDELDTLKERAEFFGLDKTKDFEEFKEKFLEFVEKDTEIDIIKVDKVISGHAGAPKISDPNSVIDHVGKSGKTETRSFYGDSGYKEKEITNHDHNYPKRHPFEKHGEHAHDYEWDKKGNLKSRTTRELTEMERKENGDML